MSAGLCACLCAVAFTVLTPVGEFTADDCAPESEMILTDDLKMESAAVQKAEPEEAVPIEEAVAQCPAEAVVVRIKCGSDEIVLNAADAGIIYGYLSSGEWIMSAANCLCNYTIYVDGAVYRYHSDCGTIQDETGHSMTLSEKDKAVFDEIVARCPMRIE